MSKLESLEYNLTYLNYDGEIWNLSKILLVDLGRRRLLISGIAIEIGLLLFSPEKSGCDPVLLFFPKLIVLSKLGILRRTTPKRCIPFNE